MPTPTEEPETPHQQVSSLQLGLQAIRETHATLPSTPGVYRMIAADGTVLYVGKAKRLNARVQNYLRTEGQPQRILRMIGLTRSMEIVNAETEQEALLLEANLIKSLRPRFNILLLDDKSFPYILIARDHRAPTLVKHRGARRRKGDYFGPFAATGAVNRTIDTLQKAFLLRNCSDTVYENRKRPCLLYQIKKCAAPCTGEISLTAYASLVDEAARFLSGKTHEVQETLAARMRNAAANHAYEDAAELRDRLSALTRIQNSQSLQSRHVEAADVFAVHLDARHACVQVFFFRNWQNWGNRAYFPALPDAVSEAAVLSAFVPQFYVSRIPPPQVILSHAPHDLELVGRSLSDAAGSPVTCVVPRRGRRLELVIQARTNAEQALNRRLLDRRSTADLLESVRVALELPEVPQRIEVFDNSHTTGSHALGAMIVSGPEGFIKSRYRTFKIKGSDLAPGDDFAMLREVLDRRYGARAASEDLPDLIVIDGGAGQLSVAAAVLSSHHRSTIPLIAIAKGADRNAGFERIFRLNRAPLLLPLRDPALYYLQRLRDEVHRFAIGAHRRRRNKTMRTSILDGLPGIGAHRKRNLLLRFGSAQAVAQAGVRDLMSVNGISRALAETIYHHFHEGSDV